MFLGHSTVLIELDGVRLLTDPLLRGRVAHLRRQVPPIEEGVFAGPDAVLISHLHHDHLDLASLRLLGRDTPLLVPAGAGRWLRRRGFTDVTELSAGEVTGIAGVGALTVTAVEARHDGRRHPGGMRAETLGYVVCGRRTVYFAGDTELFDGMSDLLGGTSESIRGRPDRTPAGASRIDVALLPVAGWGSTLGPGSHGPARRRSRGRVADAAHRDPDALGNAAADRRCPTAPGAARRSATPVCPARRTACARGRGQGSAAR